MKKDWDFKGWNFTGCSAPQHKSNNHQPSQRTPISWIIIFPFRLQFCAVTTDNRLPLMNAREKINEYYKDHKSLYILILLHIIICMRITTHIF